MSNVVALRPRDTLGGSTIAAAAGVDPYCSRVRLWLAMTGRVERPESEPMRWGTLLEPVIVDELVRRDYDVTYPVENEYADPERAWLVGHPDGWVTIDDVPGLLEVKTANAWAQWTDAVPLAYEAQVQTYLHLTGLDRALLACLVGGQRLEVRTVERSQHAIDLLLQLAAEFVEYVRTDTPPPPDGSKDARSALGVLYPDSVPDAVVRFTREQMALVRELQQRRAQMDVVKTQADALENQVRAWMGEAERAIGPRDEPVATWRGYDDKRVDTARLKQEHPTIAAALTAVTRRRRFTLA